MKDISPAIKMVSAVFSTTGVIVIGALDVVSFRLVMVGKLKNGESVQKRQLSLRMLIWTVTMSSIQLNSFGLWNAVRAIGISIRNIVMSVKSE